MHFKRHSSLSTDSLATRSSMNKDTSQMVKHSSPRAIESRAEVEQLFVLGIPLHKTSRLFQFLFSVAGVMLFYLLYGYIQVLHS